MSELRQGTHDMAGDQRDFVPDFSSDEDAPEALAESSQGEPASEGIEVNIYFPAEDASDQRKPSDSPEAANAGPAAVEQTRPHEFGFPDEPPTRPSVRPAELDESVSDEPIIAPLSKISENTEPPTAIAEQTGQHPPKRRARSPLVTVLMFALLIAVAGLLGWLAWAYENQSLPPQIAALIPTTSNLAIAPTLPVVTPGTRLEPTLRPTPRTSSTPVIGVTSLPTPTSSQATASTSATAATTAAPTKASTESSTNEPGAAQIEQGGASMVYVLGGTFAMGSTDHPNESPVHRVTLDAYYIDKFEVTNAAWKVCVADGKCQPPGDIHAYDGTPYYGVDKFDNYPVVYVNWEDAQTYCEWRGARLPTEAEWEMAARWSPATQTVTVFPWGNEWDPSRLNYCDASCLLNDLTVKDLSFDDGWPQMAPVGSFLSGASPVGALDMAGNVAEWVADWYSASYYANSPASNPAGPADGISRVVRGGAWSVDQALIRSTARSHFGGLSQVAGIGLRCAISADQVKP